MFYVHVHMQFNAVGVHDLDSVLFNVRRLENRNLKKLLIIHFISKLRFSILWYSDEHLYLSMHHREMKCTSWSEN